MKKNMIDIVYDTVLENLTDNILVVDNTEYREIDVDKVHSKFANGEEWLRQVLSQFSRKGRFDYWTLRKGRHKGRIFIKLNEEV